MRDGNCGTSRHHFPDPQTLGGMNVQITGVLVGELLDLADSRHLWPVITRQIPKISKLWGWAIFFGNVKTLANFDNSASAENPFNTIRFAFSGQFFRQPFAARKARKSKLANFLGNGAPGPPSFLLSCRNFGALGMACQP